MINGIQPGQNILHAWGELNRRRQHNVIKGLHSPLIVQNASQYRFILNIAGCDHCIETQAISIVMTARNQAAPPQTAADEDIPGIPIFRCIVEAEENAYAFRLLSVKLITIRRRKT